ncbi:hypothetical protein C7G41_12845 [Bradyrhizobium sp. MOS002]|nr:hypothetical protein C7G41_12845 [Bradyrhizobium sp. MOS002]
MGSVVFFGKCDGYSAVDESMVKLGDKLDISDDIPSATGAAIKVLLDLDYEHDDLIPEVTQFATGALNTFLKESKAKNFCSSMGKTFVDNDMVTKD